MNRSAAAESEGDAAARLPHAYPFRLVDRVLALEPERWAIGLKNLTRDDPLLTDDGTLPVVLLVEIMAQVAGLAGSARAAAAGPVVLAQINRFRCRTAAVAGDCLLVVAKVRRRFGSAVKLHAVVIVAGRRRAAAELVLQVSPHPAVGR